MPKLIDVVKKVGSAVVTEMIPAGGLIIDAVNEFLPNGQKLPATATGKQVDAAIKALPEVDRAEIMAKEIDLKVERTRQSYDTVRSMLNAEMNSPHSTRPFIVKGCFWVLAISTALAIGSFSYAVIVRDYWVIKTLGENWMFLVALLSPFVTVILAYFGILRQEQRNRLDAANGYQIGATLMNVIGKKK